VPRKLKDHDPEEAPSSSKINDNVSTSPFSCLLETTSQLKKILAFIDRWSLHKRENLKK
jgi:hypothetical protein